MMGLLIKDLYCLTKQMKIFLVLIVVLTAMPGFSMAAFAIVYSSMLPLSALAYDERSHWDSLAAMMPYSPRDLVLSKYVLGWLCILAAVILTLLMQGLLSLAGLNVAGSDGLLLGIVCLALLIQGACLPFMFKLGVEKGRLVFFALLAIVVALGFVAENRMDDLEGLPSAGLLPMILLALAVNAVSLVISMQIYRRKQV